MEMNMTAADITLDDVINAHLTLAVANGFYTKDSIERNYGSAQDIAIMARLAFHCAGAYLSLTTWANESACARTSDPITS
jgi:hypothetical protein